VISGDLYDAATLERWAGTGAARAFATKRIVRAFLERGVRGADEATAQIGAPLFETGDLQRAVESFLADGPGKATLTGA
jgi:hypothetical protein